MDRFSVCIAGAGVIGLAIAHRLARDSRFDPGTIVILEQEASFGQHISSRNSEVIHAGIYYPPDSMKAELCVRGRHLLYEHCRDFDVACQAIGKCIVSNHTEALEALETNAAGNGVEDLEIWDEARLTVHEPALAAKYALFSPSTGIIDSHGYMQSLLSLAQMHGVLFAPRTRIQAVHLSGDGFRVETEIEQSGMREPYTLQSEVFINCAGLNAGRLARQIEGVNPALVPEQFFCKGDYFSYPGRNPFNHLIYPVPKQAMAGLGIHSVPDLSGQLRFGPDAEYVDSIHYDVDPGKAAAFADAISDYFPAIRSADLQPAYSGVRPRLAGPGSAPADFVIQSSTTHGVEGLLQFFGMESPGLTASLAIADYAVELLS